MNELLREIPDRILELAKCAFSQANTHLTFADRRRLLRYRSIQQAAALGRIRSDILTL